ncbi:N-terminal acetyltransferase A complex auxiliary subunit NAA15, partial [Astathelohania contejeani]
MSIIELIESKNYRKALEIIDIKLSITPNETNLLALKGYTQHLNNHTILGIKTIKEAIKIDIKNPEPWKYLATVYLDSDQFEEALQAFKRSFILGARSGFVIRRLHSLNLFFRKFDEFKEDAEKIFSKERSEENKMILAVAYFITGNHEKSVKLMGYSIFSEPTSKLYNLNKEKLLKSENRFTKIYEMIDRREYKNIEKELKGWNIKDVCQEMENLEWNQLIYKLAKSLYDNGHIFYAAHFIFILLKNFSKHFIFQFSIILFLMENKRFCDIIELVSYNIFEEDDYMKGIALAKQINAKICKMEDIDKDEISVFEDINPDIKGFL